MPPRWARTRPRQDRPGRINKPYGEEGYINLGSASEATLNAEYEYLEVQGNDDTAAYTLVREVKSRKGTISLSLQQKTPLAVAIANGDDNYKRYFTQDAVDAATKTIVNAEVGKVYLLGPKNVSVDTVAWGAGEMDEGVHYRVDRRVGAVEILAKPAAAVGSDVTVTYDAAAIAAAAKVLDVGGLNGVIRGALYVRGVNQSGFRCEIFVHDVEFGPDGAQPLLSTGDADVVKITGQVFPADGQPEAFKFWRLTQMSDAALA
jgi:hypothetical protein